MAENYIITKKRRECLVKASAGAMTLPKIVGMAFGDGGCDESGAAVPPSEDQEGLSNELKRKAFDRYTFPEATTCRYECTLTTDELAGKEISEIGLYDENDDICAIKTFTKKGKDADLEMTFAIDDIF